MQIAGPRRALRIAQAAQEPPGFAALPATISSSFLGKGFEAHLDSAREIGWVAKVSMG